MIEKHLVIGGLGDGVIKSGNHPIRKSPNSLDKAVRAQGGAVVKPHQVKAMILAARRAYNHCVIGGLGDGVIKSDNHPISKSDNAPSFDAWRRATLHDVVGAAAPSSFRAVTQRDYARVVAYFLELAGDGGIAAAAHDKTADERRRALWALNLEEGRLEDYFGGREGTRRYADSLFWKIHKTDRITATARQVWAVIFTLRSRAAKRRFKV